MDPQSLLQLLSESTEKLGVLHAELGHPPHHLEEAIHALHTTLHAAVQGQMDRVQEEVDQAKATLKEGQERIDQLKTALGDSDGAAQGRRSSRTRGASGRVGDANEVSPREDANSCIWSDLMANTSHSSHPQPLLPRVASVSSEISRLQNLYNSRRQQADKLAAELASFTPILGNFVPDLQPTESAGEASTTVSTILPLPASYLTQLSSAIDKCGHELTRRSEELQGHLYEILGLWSELCLAPETEPSQNIDGEPTFDSLILRHLRLQTVWEEVQVDEEEGGRTVLEFQGTFLPIEGSQDDERGGAPDTPSRQGGSGSSTLQSMRSAETHFPPHVLQPNPTNISRAQAKREWLEQEKSRRESRIQELYDSLFQLWVKFEVPEEDMDKFVMGNSGSTMAVIEAYEGELDKMQELKQQHMALFVGKVRERIDELWGELRLSPEQKEITFPEFFQRLEEADPSDLDILLSRHEERVMELEREVETKAPLLKLVGKYLDLCQEEQQLEESAKDTTRLMKGVRGDPGRLLREEKMRKRVKIQKPKLEAELLKAIPAWEVECGQTFTIDGEKYYEKIQALSSDGAAAAASKKRVRTASVATPSAANGAGVLQQSTAHTNRIAPTPMRTPSTAPGRGAPSSTGAALSKKPRLLDSSKPARTAATPSATYNNGNLRARVAPTPSTASRLPSLSRIPGPPPATGQKPSAGPPTMSALVKGTSTAGYQAGHGFRPRPSQVARAAVASMCGGAGGGGRWPGDPQPPLPRNTSGASNASDATTLHYPGSAAPSGYAQAIPSRPPISSTNSFTGASAAQGRRSVQSGKARRGPSMSLEGALASMATTSYAKLHSAGASNGGGGGSSGNWAVLEEDDDDGNGLAHHHQDEMEVF